MMKRSSRRILAAGAGALAALPACTPEPPAPPPAATDVSANGERERPVLVASNRGRTSLAPAAITLGRFIVEEGCLRFATAERSYLAVFGSAGAPTVSGTGFTVAGRRIVLGEEYQVGGGPQSLEPGVFELSPEIERSCPGPYFQLGPILPR